MNNQSYRLPIETEVGIPYGKFFKVLITVLSPIEEEWPILIDEKSPLSTAP